MNMFNCYRTAESVSCGHPDSYTDYLVNSILDEYLSQDPDARVAIDGVVKNKYVTLGGEITSTAKVDIPSIIKRCTKEIGYDFEPEITLHIYEQSPDIAKGTNTGMGKDLGAGDQGTITGYACSGNISYIPLEKALADELVRTMFMEYRTKYPEIKSDMKSQVTLYYDKSGNLNIDTVVFACQHSENVSSDLIQSLVELAMTDVLLKFSLNPSLLKSTKFIVNGTGQFIQGGPEADSGEVGRKIVVDSYGVSVPVGGGTYNGKDPSKVDRSAAYYARYVAKNIVSSGVARECLITVSYCIGKADPISIDYEFFGTEIIDKKLIINACNKLFSFRPADIINALDLKKPIYATSGMICHFGNMVKQSLSTGEFVNIPWEFTDKVLDILQYVKQEFIDEFSKDFDLQFHNTTMKGD